MDNNELAKIIKFIKKYKKVLLKETNLFSKTSLLYNQYINNDKRSSEFELTEDEKNLIIKTFLNNSTSFNRDTPNIILTNPECLKLVIAHNINNINYLKHLEHYEIDQDLEDYLVKEALKQKYVLTKNSPLFLRKNYQVAANSIKLKVQSADYIAGYLLKESERNTLINELMNNKYKLSANSASFLKASEKIVYKAIKKNINNIKYAHYEVKYYPEIFKYLMLNNYHFDKLEISSNKLHLNCFNEPEILTKVFKVKEFYFSNNPQYIERFTKLYSDAINSKPLIKNMNPIFQHAAEEMWEDFRYENNEFYDNVFGKICAELRNADTFAEAIYNLPLLSEMKIILESQYLKLEQAMQEYYQIYHSTAQNKSEKLTTSKDIIANLSALYISKSKDNFIHTQIQTYAQSVYSYFSLNMDNSYIYKKLVVLRKKEKFREMYLYQFKSPEISNFTNEIVETYQHEAEPGIILTLIENFVIRRKTKLHEFETPPYRYYEYLRYEKAIKLIRRLNSGFIRYNGIEVFNYRDLIKYDAEKQEYVYTEYMFSEKCLNEINKYRKLWQLFEKIKRDIMYKVNSMEFDGEFDLEAQNKLCEQLPFTDEYFVFNTEDALSEVNLYTLENATMGENPLNIETFLSDEAYSYVYDLFVNKGLFWILISLLYNPDQNLEDCGLTTENIVDIINNMEHLIKLAKDFKFDLHKFNELMLVYDVSKVTTEIDFAIFGKDIIRSLCRNQDYVVNSSKKIIEMSKELVCQMVKRNTSTVPYVSGEYLNYRYSMYDSQDFRILMAGIDTDACFKIDGNDNDFLHYCALDKNGFVIKITDEFGSFIGRASGFRNGNCVFINQLRTIYDESGNEYLNEYHYEACDIIDVFKKVCEQIVITSQSNPDELTKIDFVFVTKSYSLENYPTNISDDVECEIGDYPMDTQSDDWQQFITNTKNLEEAPDYDLFSVDYGNYPIICMASSKDINDIQADDIKKQDVLALYKRKRNNITVIKSFNGEGYEQVNKIKAIACYLQEKKFTVFEIPEDSLVITGDNWYIIYHHGKIINECVLKFDYDAKREYQATFEVLNQLKCQSNQLINIEQITKNITKLSSNHYSRVLTRIPSKD